MGAALSPGAVTVDARALAEKVETYQSKAAFAGCRPLFENPADYDAFITRHKTDSRGIHEITEPSGDLFLGIDAGSTTVKAVLCDREGNLFCPMYSVG